MSALDLDRYLVGFVARLLEDEYVALPDAIWAVDQRRIARVHLNRSLLAAAVRELLVVHRQVGLLLLSRRDHDGHQGASMHLDLGNAEELAS